ncbi:hypothetical protein CKM354_000834300 [Cercospora kikuchii]|uniref:Peptidase S26 domain-containing protein n=1 Tax=Cercospora kikuchii TaxID=84275 RepID=A0A9P3CL33_9PEZI|nr:endopeptidase catalytic subunit IMP1 [Cercospora kikuchii]GIZ45162.1 hypothetical protein CKM354_000834300 [Cercospora kikuchii]
MYATAFLLGYHVFTNYFYVIDDCHGQSMLPTFAYTGDLVCLSRYYRRGRGIQIGDLVSFKIPIKDEYGLKRVVGMPGDFVLMDTPGKSDAMIQVPEGHCWVAGDNLAHSRDSRHYGPIPLALIHGKAVFKYHYRHWMPTGFTTFARGLKPAVIEDDID